MARRGQLPGNATRVDRHDRCARTFRHRISLMFTERARRAQRQDTHAQLQRVRYGAALGVGCRVRGCDSERMFCRGWVIEALCRLLPVDNGMMVARKKL